MIHTCSSILSPFQQERRMRTEPSLNDALIKIAEVCQVGGMRVLVNAVGVLHPRQNLTKGRHFPLTPFRYFILFRERLQWLCWVAFRMLCAAIREFQEKVSLCLNRSFLSLSGATFLTRHALYGKQYASRCLSGHQSVDTAAAMMVTTKMARSCSLLAGSVKLEAWVLP